MHPSRRLYRTPIALLSSLLHVVGCTTDDASLHSGDSREDGGEDTSTTGDAATADGGRSDTTSVVDAPVGPDAAIDTHGPAEDTRFVDVSAPVGEWFNATSNLAGMDSECGNLSFLSVRPATDQLIAGIAKHGLWSSVDGGASWTAIGKGAGSATITNRASSILYDPLDATHFWESGIYNDSGVYFTSNGGSTFGALGDSHHCDSVSVDFTDPARLVLMAGGHEQAQTLYRSTDAGLHWTNVGLKLSADDRKCNEPLVLDAKTHLVGCWDYDGSGGISRTTDGGNTWTRVYRKGLTSSHPLVTDDGSIYWTRSGGGLVKSTDHGLTWTEIGTGSGLSSLSPVALPGGRIAAYGGSGIAISSDGGTTWKTITTKAPFNPNGLAYSRPRHSFYAWHFSCDNPVPADAVMGVVIDPALVAP